MKTISRFITTTLFILLAGYVQALTVYVCVDPNGAEEFYSDRCPPGTSKTAEKEVRVASEKTEGDLSEIAERNPITIYVSNDCDACDLVRHQLDARGIPFTEKDAGADLEAQTELQELSGGLKIPTLTVAGEVLTGYNKGALEKALSAAGYPSPEAKTEE